MIPSIDYSSIAGLLFGFAFFYPLFMAYVWIIGGLYYYFHWELKKGLGPDKPPKLPLYPPVSIIVPCHNEGDNIRETLTCLLKQDYPDFDVIAVNDGSSDDTADILDSMARRHAPLRVVHLASNQGKAMALRMGALATPNEFIVCIDGDAMLHPHATQWLISHFINGPRVGAVTGNPRIRNRSTLLGKIQVGEFSSIIGLIKRTQRIYGRVFTVSGVVTAFRKAALHRTKYWNVDMITEDIDISWLLQMDHWDIRYESNALCWILMPETLTGLWRQRLRWARGGVEVFIRYWKDMLCWRKRRMWGVFLEFLISVAWAYVMAFVFVLWALGKFLDLPDSITVPTLIPQWNGILLGFTCLLQFAVSLAIDSRYEKKLGRYYYWMVWYPIAFWLINMVTTVVALPKTLLKRRRQRAIWTSPDRGLTDRRTTS